MTFSAATFSALPLALQMEASAGLRRHVSTHRLLAPRAGRTAPLYSSPPQAPFLDTCRKRRPPAEVRSVSVGSGKEALRAPAARAESMGSALRRAGGAAAASYTRGSMRSSAAASRSTCGSGRLTHRKDWPKVVEDSPMPHAGANAGTSGKCGHECVSHTPPLLSAARTPLACALKEPAVDGSGRKRAGGSSFQCTASVALARRAAARALRVAPSAEVAPPAREEAKGRVPSGAPDSARG